MSFAAQYDDDIDEVELSEGCVYWRAQNATGAIKLKSPVKRTPAAAQLPSPSTTSSKGSIDPTRRLMKRRKPVPSSSAPMVALDKFTLKCMDALESKLASKIESSLRTMDPNSPRLRSHSKGKDKATDSPLKLQTVTSGSPSRVPIEQRNTLKSSLSATKAFSPNSTKTRPPSGLSRAATAPDPPKDKFDEELDGDESFEMALSQIADKQLTSSQRSKVPSPKVPKGSPSTTSRPPLQRAQSSMAASRAAAVRTASAGSVKPMPAAKPPLVPTNGVREQVQARNPFQSRPANVTIAKAPTVPTMARANTASAQFRPARATTAPAKVGAASAPRQPVNRQMQDDMVKAELAAIACADLGSWSDDDLEL